MNKDKLVSIEEYATWFVCNVIFCVLPIGIIWIIGRLTGYLNLSIVFSSILAFLFTLMLTSMYAFFPYPRLRQERIGKQILIFTSFLVACLVLILFVLYNLMPELKQCVNTNMHYWFILLIALVLAILLNRDAIADRIREKRIVVKMAETLMKGEKKGEEWIELFTGEGENENG